MGSVAPVGRTCYHPRVPRHPSEMTTQRLVLVGLCAFLAVCHPSRTPSSERRQSESRPGADVNREKRARTALEELLVLERRYLTRLEEEVENASRMPKESQREILARVRADLDSNERIRSRVPRAGSLDELKEILRDFWDAVEAHRDAMQELAPQQYPRLVQREEFRNLLEPLGSAYRKSRQILASDGVASEPKLGAPVAAELRFTIDLTAARATRAEDVLRTNVAAYTHESIPPAIWEKFLAEQRVGDVLIDPVGDFIGSKSFEDLRSRLRKNDALVKQILSAGGRVQLMIGSAIMPRWLSSQPKNEGDLFAGGLSEGVKIWRSVPPSDFAKWREVAKAVVHHFNVELQARGRIYYVVGNEPDNYWVGTEDEHNEYYRSFVLGALDADPDVRLGGITPAQFDAKRFSKFNPRSKPDGSVEFQEIATKNGKPILYNWIAYCRAKGLPIRVVTWHQYPAASPTPPEGTLWLWGERQIRSWLAEFGYSDVELILNDWPEWRPVLEENDSEFKAAYVAAGVTAMVSNGDLTPVYLGLRDMSAYTDKGAAGASGSFGGGTGLFTRVGIAKPVYSAYALSSKMKGQIVPVETGDDFVQALAAVDGESVSVLLSNFIPSRRIMSRNTFGASGAALAEEELDMIRKRIQAQGWDRERLMKELLDGTLEVGKLGLPEGLTRRLEGLQNLARRRPKRGAEPVTISVAISGTARKGRFLRYEEYVVDETHANSYSLREEIAAKVGELEETRDRDAAMRLVADVNRRTDVASGKIRDERLAGDGETLTITVVMRPNAVHLVVLSPMGGGS